MTTSITKLNEDYLAAKTRRILLEAALKQIDDKRRRGESLETVPQMATDGMIGSLNEQLSTQNLQLSQLRGKYKEGHPEVQKAQAQLTELRKTRDARFGQIVDALRAEYAQLEKRETEFRSAIEGQKSQAATQSRKSSEMEILKKEEQSATSLYEVLLQKLNETDIASSIRNNNVSVVESANPPLYPIRPAKRRIAAMALALGLALGIGLVFARDYLDNTIRGFGRGALPHLVVAAVPWVRRGQRPRDRGLPEPAHRPHLRPPRVGPRCCHRHHPQEGKTTTLVNTPLLACRGERRWPSTAPPAVQPHPPRYARGAGCCFRPPRRPRQSHPARGCPLCLTRGRSRQPPPSQADGDLPTTSPAVRLGLADAPPVASVTDALLLARHADIVVYGGGCCGQEAHQEERMRWR